ncbi:MAG: hypothetical protein RMK45_10600 [Armatimonadota bacterium]|nr:hypothetical protein [Armatimonadota bacterium]
MVIYIQERFTEVRACLEELTLPPAFTPTAVQLLHLPAPLQQEPSC